MSTVIGITGGLTLISLGLFCAVIAGMYGEEGKADAANTFLAIAGFLTGLGVLAVRLA